MAVLVIAVTKCIHLYF